MKNTFPAELLVLSDDFMLTRLRIQIDDYSEQESSVSTTELEKIDIGEKGFVQRIKQLDSRCGLPKLFVLSTRVLATNQTTIFINEDKEVQVGPVGEIVYSDGNFLVRKCGQ